uniref:Keratin-associated protein 8-1 n=1 Tax=Bos mutus grunniens TaxID=30521 RepID=A0A8B9W5X1_BOSMU
MSCGFFNEGIYPGYYWGSWGYPLGYSAGCGYGSTYSPVGDGFRCGYGSTYSPVGDGFRCGYGGFRPFDYSRYWTFDLY